MKYRYISLFIITILGIAAVLFTVHDAFLYDSTIVKVINVENTFSHEEDGPDGETEKYYDQKLSVLILNGDKKGDIININNTYTDSGVNDEKYRKGTRLIVALNDRGDGGSILQKKRDVYVVLFFVMFVFMLAAVSGRHGLVVLFSFIINMLLLLIAFRVYDIYGNIIKIIGVTMMIFGILTLVFAGGLSKKTWVAVISTLVTTLICLGIYNICMRTSERIPYEMMDYIVNPKDLADLFLAGTLMGSLGAVMDVCISISAGVAEICTKTPDIKIKSLSNSIREMGYDIMGTMINVLFFTYLSGTIPILVIKIKNGYTLYHLVRFQLFFEMICFFVGAIGIVLAIPVSGFFSVLFFGKNTTGTVTDREVDA